MAETCPYGGEIKPNGEAYLQLTNTIIDAVFGNAWYVAPLKAYFLGQVWAIGEICAAGPYDYPPLTEDVLASAYGLQEWAMRWLAAYLWDEYCQCADPANGCGDEYLADAPGLRHLDTLTATHHNTPGSGIPPTKVNTTTAHGGGTVYLNAPAGGQAGDLVVLNAMCNYAQGVNYSGSWNVLLRHANGTNVQNNLVWQWYENVSWPISCTRGSGQGDQSVVLSIWRGVDPLTTPELVEDSGCIVTTSQTLASIDLAEKEIALVFNASDSSTQEASYASGWDVVDGASDFVSAMKEVYSGASVGRPTGSITCPATGSCWLRAVSIKLTGLESGETDWCSWSEPAGESWGYAVQDDSGTLADHNQHGYSPDGYYVTFHWPAANGGDREDGNCQWKVYDADLNELETVSVPYFEPWEGAVWPCFYQQEPETPPQPPEGTEDPTPPTDCDLCDLVAVVDELRDQIASMANMMSYIAGLSTVDSGPYPGVVGPGGTGTGGNFQQTVLSALAQLLNTYPSGYTETLLEGNVVGDATFAQAYDGYRIHFTTIPAWVGKRLANVPYYEVNSRKEQLGWMSFLASGGHLDNRILVWENMTVWTPTSPSQGMELHLADGCECEVYGLTKTYSVATP